jgi:hypothetical protein
MGPSSCFVQEIGKKDVVLCLSPVDFVLGLEDVS